jgi:hypothetical protein
VDGLPRWFDQADSDHDARLTRAEFEADHLRFFRLVDVNGDGVIDGAEVQRYEHDIAPELLSRVDRGEGRFQGRGGPGPGGGRGHGGGRGGGGRPGGGGLQDSPALGLLNEPEPLLAADTDLDFKVTLKEWQAAAADRFARLDAARHGALSLDELRHRPGGSGEARRR